MLQTVKARELEEKAGHTLEGTQYLVKFKRLLLET
jgi:hypothetical protein